MKFPKDVKVGDFVNQVTVTEIKGKKVFGVTGHLPTETVEALKAYFAKPAKERGFMFRPGNHVGEKE